jgi:hypothetical protein
MTADQQYGEVDPSGNTYLSYWVDQALASIYPSTPASPGPSILELIGDRYNYGGNAGHKERRWLSDGDGGRPRGCFANRQQRRRRRAHGDCGCFQPGELQFGELAEHQCGQQREQCAGSVAVTPASRMTVSLAGYGVAWLVLKP